MHILLNIGEPDRRDRREVFNIKDQPEGQVAGKGIEVETFTFGGQVNRRYHHRTSWWRHHTGNWQSRATTPDVLSPAEIVVAEGLIDRFYGQLPEAICEAFKQAGYQAEVSNEGCSVEVLLTDRASFLGVMTNLTSVNSDAA